MRGFLHENRLTMVNPNSPARRCNNRNRTSRNSPKKGKRGSKRDAVPSPAKTGSPPSKSDEKRLREDNNDKESDISMDGNEANDDESVRKDLMASFEGQNTTETMEEEVAFMEVAKGSTENNEEEKMEVEENDDEQVVEIDIWKEPVTQQTMAFQRALKTCEDIPNAEKFTAADEKVTEELINGLRTAIGWVENDALPVDLINDAFEAALEYNSSLSEPGLAEIRTLAVRMANADPITIFDETKWSVRRLIPDDKASSWESAYRLLGAPWCKRKHICPEGTKYVKSKKTTGFSESNDVINIASNTPAPLIIRKPIISADEHARNINDVLGKDDKIFCKVRLPSIVAQNNELWAQQTEALGNFKNVLDRAWEIDPAFKIHAWTEDGSSETIGHDDKFPTSRSSMDRFVNSFCTRHGYFTWFKAATLNANQQIVQANQQTVLANNAAQQAANAAQLATQAANAANQAATQANQARDAANLAKARVEQDRNNAVACIEMVSEQRNMLQAETTMVDTFLDRCGTSWEDVVEQLTLEKVVAKNMELHKKTWEQRKRAQEKKDGKTSVRRVNKTRNKAHQSASLETAVVCKGAKS